MVFRLRRDRLPDHRRYRSGRLASGHAGLRVAGAGPVSGLAENGRFPCLCEPLVLQCGQRAVSRSASTAEERSGSAYCLVEHDSELLDIACGTGQLAHDEPSRSSLATANAVGRSATSASISPRAQRHLRVASSRTRRRARCGRPATVPRMGRGMSEAALRPVAHKADADAVARDLARELARREPSGPRPGCARRAAHATRSRSHSGPPSGWLIPPSRRSTARSPVSHRW